jgi:hypothetical protein
MNSNNGMTEYAKVKEHPPPVRVVEGERMGERVVDSYGDLPSAVTFQSLHEGRK